MGFSKIHFGTERVLDRQLMKDESYRITNETRLTLDIQGDHEAVSEIHDAVKALINKRVPPGVV